jgi:hypothetical protein
VVPKELVCGLAPLSAKHLIICDTNTPVTIESLRIRLWSFVDSQLYSEEMGMILVASELVMSTLKTLYLAHIVNRIVE